jgi:transglutaminase-like putative cysteine protease
MRYRVSHIIRVEHGQPIRMARFNLRLRPIDWPGQQVSDLKLVIDPQPGMQEDIVGTLPVNLTRIEIAQPIRVLEIRSTFLATVDDAQFDLSGEALSIADTARAALASDDLGPFSPALYIYPSALLPEVAEIADWAVPQLAPSAPALATALALAQRIQREFRYDPKATETDTPVAEAFAIRRGVCQDFAHILIVALRAAGLPAAYMSGYLRTYPPPGKARLVGADAMHAWVALWCGPRRGWVGIDPTNGCLANSDHLVVAMGRDFADISPIDGVFVGGRSQRTFNAVDVSPIESDSESGKPG